MIEEARILEYSGPLLALLKWASAMKQFILYTIFCNVLILPWGLSIDGHGDRRARRGGRAHRQVHARRLRRRVRRDRPVAPALLPLSGAARRVLPAGGAVDHRHPIELAPCSSSISARLPRRSSACSRSPACCCPSSCWDRAGSRIISTPSRPRSWIIAALSAAVGYYGNYPELYLIAAPDAAVSRHAPALSDLADHPPPGGRSRNPRDSPAEQRASSSAPSSCMFALAVSYPRRDRLPSGADGRGPGADGHAVDEADRLSDARRPSRGDQPDPRPAGARERHLPRLADPRARHAAADRDGDPVRSADRRRLLRRARRLSPDPCRRRPAASTSRGWSDDGRRAAPRAVARAAGRRRSAASSSAGRACARRST